MFAALDGYGPTLIGTFPLGLTVAGSDLDIACFAPDLDGFAATVSEAFGRWPEYSASSVPTAPPAHIATFRLDDMRVEIFGQPLPVHRQNGFRHMAIEARLLVAGGAPLRRRVLHLRGEGLGTEPAFAAALGLGGDPYRALLDLESLDEAALRALCR